MPRATGTFQQKELRAKLLRLEQEIARARVAAQRSSQEAEKRLSGVQESIAQVASEANDAESSDRVPTGDSGPEKTKTRDEGR